MDSFSFWACPRCNSDRHTNELSTTNEWVLYCRGCDVRFNKKGDIRPADKEKAKVVDFNDRRSSKHKSNGKIAGKIGFMTDAEAHEADVREAARKAGAAPLTSFFSEEVLYKPVTRGDYLRLRGVEEHNRRERTWYRMAWRWLTMRPQVKDVVGSLARAHARTLDKIASDAVKASKLGHEQPPKPPKGVA